MKKVFTVLLICYILFLCACSTTQGIPTETLDDSLYCEAGPRGFHTVEEFNVFIAEIGGRLPKEFITWEEASRLGSVDYLAMSDFGSYQYSLIDSAGVNIHLSIEQQPEITQQATLYVDTVTTVGGSLRRITSSGNPLFFVRNGIEYGYSAGGELVLISFHKDNMRISLHNYLHEYPENQTDTIVGRLLSADDSVANAAFAEILQKLDK